MNVYENIINRRDVIPWHIVHSDSNRQKLTIVAKAVLKESVSMKLEWPNLQTEFIDINKPR